MPRAGSQGRHHGPQVDTAARGARSPSRSGRPSVKHLRDLIDGLGPSILVGLLTPDGTLIEGNQSALTATGMSRADSLGKPFADLYPWAYSYKVQQQLREAIDRAARGEGSRYDVQLRTVDDRPIIVDFSLQPLRDETGRVAFLVPSAVIITERKRVETALLASRARTQLLVESSNIGLWDWTIATNEIFFSPEWKQHIGYADHELPSRCEEWLDRLHPEDRERSLEAVKGYVEGRRADYDVTYRMRHRDGSWRWILSRAQLMRNAAGAPVRLMGCHIDVTERRQEEEVLRHAGERLQALSRQLLEVREQEQRELARELHDEIGQALSAIKINLQALQRFPDPDAIVSRLDESIAILERALQQVRSRSLELHAPLLDDLGLAAALRWLAEQYASRTGLSVTFDSALIQTRFDAMVEISCFRIAQEAVNNVVTHAGARNIAVDLHEQDGRLDLWVRDDGAGFDVAAARRRAVQGESLGLLSMEERAALAGGVIEWRSRPGVGTEVHVCFALDPRVGIDPNTWATA